MIGDLRASLAAGGMKHHFGEISETLSRSMSLTSAHHAAFLQMRGFQLSFPKRVGMK